MHVTTLLHSLSVLAGSAFAAYKLEDDYFDGSFFDKFEFWDLDDPTHGFVKYGNRTTSEELGLLNSTDGNIKMFVDSNNVTPKGRPSVRIKTSKVYNQALIVIDMDHMPGGICGTWPAFWTLGPAWPTHGEIDIMEGVHDQPGNKMTLHSGPLCTNLTNTGGTGKVTLTECLSGDGTQNSGCQIATNDSITYGAGFNANKGGVYATEWLADSISMWFFPRGHCPTDALGDCPDPSSWGPPLARFITGDECDISAAFKDQQLLFDTTFCGDWAGQPTVWGNSTCAKKTDTCEEYVRENPKDFADAYWSVNALKVYTDGDKKSDAPANPGPAAQSTNTVYQPAPPTSAPKAQGGGSSTGTNGAASFAKREDEQREYARHLGAHKRRGGLKL
ncbi:putative endo-beta-1,3(4)-glucanase [Zymoseptoria tritici IPO323]|uniref:endo-1,3(4)-beta-glucanase n=1 Tax=Zymoseptoria tritici (strain CBS 115943 / IPO323) TaxID=336722 RepID=F9XC84_ZYMTI|nr:putative endo-beta-1,3(4)-glucanase [Zymoseptoria tritici IPO323]EGP87163.1 putative endo-beta-1,3(4)-glucanase [Zymoseptoria tritici IPO323]